MECEMIKMEKTTREQREDWLNSIGISAAGFNRSIRAMIAKDTARQAKKKSERLMASRQYRLCKGVTD